MGDLNLLWSKIRKCRRGSPCLTSIVRRAASEVRERAGISVPCTQRDNKQWLRRWRIRRGLELRKFLPFEALPREEMQCRVTHQEGPQKILPCSTPRNRRPAGWKKKRPHIGLLFATGLPSSPQFHAKSCPENGRRFLETCGRFVFSRPRFFVHVVSCEAKAVWRRCNFLVS